MFSWNNKYLLGFALVIFYLIIEVAGSRISNYLFPSNQQISSSPNIKEDTTLAYRPSIRDSNKIDSIKKQTEHYKNNTYKELPPPLCKNDKNVKCFGQKITDSYQYVGHLLNDQPHGSGHQIYPDNKYYVGNFRDGLADGYGVYYDEFDRVIYDGDWYEDTYNGKGILFVGEEYYDGFFKDGEFHGLGTYVYGDRTFTGKWYQGLRHGEGKETWLVGDTYTGYWTYDSISSGEYYQASTGMQYRGDFLDDTYHGNGAFTFRSGDTYVGQLKFGEFHGQGTYRQKDVNGVTVYEAEYKNGAYHGKHKITFPHGETHTGTYKNGFMDKKWILIFREGQRQIKSYKEGVLHGPYEIFYTDGAKETTLYNDGFKTLSNYEFVHGDKNTCEYKKSILHGTCTYTYAKDNSKEICRYDNGKPEGCTYE